MWAATQLAKAPGPGMQGAGAALRAPGRGRDCTGSLTFASRHLPAQIESEDEWICAQTLAGPGLGHESTVWDVAFDPAGTHMASVSDDRTLRIWECSRQQGALSAVKIKRKKH